MKQIKPQKRKFLTTPGTHGFPKSYDYFGSTAIVKFPKITKQSEKKKAAENLIKKQKSIKTVLEKTQRVKGRLRKISTRYLAGINTKEVLYKENNCIFRFNIDKAYFSPRLSNERKEISEEIYKISKNQKNKQTQLKILVMFAGVSPYSIVIAKKCKNCKISSIEINKEASKYSEINKKLNNLKNLEIIQGDVKKISKKLNEKFDFIIMPRPQLKETFLKQAFQLSKKGTRIYYYDFCKIEDKNKIIEKIIQEAKKNKINIKILNIKKAGEIAPFKIRLRIDFITV